MLPIRVVFKNNDEKLLKIDELIEVKRQMLQDKQKTIGKIAKQNNIPIDISLETSETDTEEKNSEQKMDSSSISIDSIESSFYDNHPAFQTDVIPITTRPPSSISTDFVDLLSEEFRNKLNCRVNELVYKIMDLESTLKNLTDDYDQLLLENQQLKKQLEK